MRPPSTLRTGTKQDWWRLRCRLRPQGPLVPQRDAAPLQKPPEILGIRKRKQTELPASLCAGPCSQSFMQECCVGLFNLHNSPMTGHRECLRFAEGEIEAQRDAVLCLSLPMRTCRGGGGHLAVLVQGLQPRFWRKAAP